MNANDKIVEQHTSLNEHAIRQEKVAFLLKQGINPWPSSVLATATTRQAREHYKGEEPQAHGLKAVLDKITSEFENAQTFAHKEVETKEPEYALAGRLMSRRDHGKTFFAHLHDREGNLQLYFKQETVGEASFNLFVHAIDVGDTIWVNGTLFTTKKGEVTLHVTAWKLLSKCLHPLPEKYHGLANVEQRYRQRYLDLMSNPES